MFFFFKHDLILPGFSHTGVRLERLMCVILGSNQKQCVRLFHLEDLGCIGECVPLDVCLYVQYVTYVFNRYIMFSLNAITTTTQFSSC